MKQLALISLLASSNLIYSQTASFYANPFVFAYKPDTSSEHYRHIMEMNWRINGEKLNWYSDTVYIKTDNIPDTILFQQHKQAKIDTLICMISLPMNYEFNYNECCGGFNVRWDKHRHWGAVQFSVLNARKKNYLGRIGETLLVVNQDSLNVLSPQCISAMAPNIHHVALSEFMYCKPGENCQNESPLDCLVAYNDGPMVDSFNLQVTRQLYNFLYLPLSNDPLQIIYDVRSGKITIHY